MIYLPIYLHIIIFLYFYLFTYSIYLSTSPSPPPHPRAGKLRSNMLPLRFIDVFQLIITRH